MRPRIILIMAVLLFALSAASCNENTKNRIDVEKYREEVRKSGQQNSITPEEREKVLKELFPKYKSK